MGMVIEDGYFFVCVLGGKDLSDVIQIEIVCEKYEGEWIVYVNYYVEFVCEFGDCFYKVFGIVVWLCDFVFDNIGVLEKFICKDYLWDVELMLF